MRSARSSPPSAEGIAVGDHVLHGLGWREYATSTPSTPSRSTPDCAPLSTYLGVLGMTGLTAYAGLLRSPPSRRATPSSSPARPVPSAARSARSPSSRAPPGSSAPPAPTRRSSSSSRSTASTRPSTTRTARWASSCARPLPTASTSTSTTSAATTWRRRSAPSTCTAAIAICGMISQYNSTEPVPGPRNLALRHPGKRLRLQGLLVGDHDDLQPQFVQEVGRLGGLRRAEVPRDGRRGHRERPARRSSGCCAATTSGRWSSSSDVSRTPRARLLLFSVMR